MKFLDSLYVLCIIFDVLTSANPCDFPVSWHIPPTVKDFLLEPPAQIVIWTTVLVVLMTVGWYLVGRFRDNADDDRLTANELLTNFQDLHHRGDIDDAEYRTIKTVLGTKLRKELKDTDNKG
jgi:hypothetical protein